jgi:hypothetical protein
MSRGRLIRSLALGAVIATAGAGFAGCSSSAEPLPPPDGLTVSIKQGRLDVVAGRLVVRFENTGDAPVTITGFDLRTPTFAQQLERTEPIDLDAHDAIDVRLDLPESDCDTEPGPVLVALEHRSAAGTGSGELTADDPFDTVGRVNAADCLAESVADVATIVMPEHLRSTGTEAERRAFIDIEVVPEASGDASMRIERVYGTTLLNAEGGIDWTLGTDVAAGDAPFTVSLPVRPARCDAHAIADDKRGTILPFDVATNDGRSGRLDVPAPDGLKAELYAYFGERCGLELPAG